MSYRSPLPPPNGQVTGEHPPAARAWPSPDPHYMERVIQARVAAALAAAETPTTTLYQRGFEAIQNTPDYDLPTGMRDGTVLAVPLRFRGGAPSRIEIDRATPAAPWHHTYLTRLVLAKKNVVESGTTLDELAAPFIALDEQVLLTDPEKLFAPGTQNEVYFEYEKRRYGVSVGQPLERGVKHMHRLDPSLNLPTDQLFVRQVVGENDLYVPRQTIATGAAAIKLFAGYGIPDNSLANLTDGGENLFAKVNTVFA